MSSRRPEVKKINKKNIFIPIIAAILFFVVVVSIYASVGSKAVGEHSFYDSFTLQAMAWRRGEAKLDQNYPYLELAIVNEEYFATHDMDDYEAYREKFGDVGAPIEHQEGNEYYVSFPPFPSVPMFFLTFIFGENTPSTFMTILYLTLAFYFCILICKRFNFNNTISICGALFVCMASSSLFIATNNNAGGVWFMAQALSLCLTSAAFYFILGNKDRDYFTAFILLACAVGCRPFQIVYFLPFAYIVARKYDFKILKTWKFYVAPAIIGGLYMLYNYIRFGNPLEFGHNYLPEFMRMPAGQFGIEYLSENLKNLFIQMPEFDENGLVTMWGFAFYVCNVLFIMILISLIFRFSVNIGSKIKVKDEYNIEKYIFGAMILIHFILFPLHKTLGGWQFGSRYTADILPAVLVLVCMILYSVLNRRKAPSKDSLTLFYVFSSIILIFGCIFNIYGCYIMF